MELTFEQQVIVAVIGGVMASILTSILNNWWTDRRLHDQWEREKEERREQWRREQEARRREWKREYRKELLRPYLKKVNRILAVSGMLIVETEVSSDVPDEAIRLRRDRLSQLTEEVFSTGTTGIEDKEFSQLQEGFSDVLTSLVEATRWDIAKDYYEQLQDIADKLHKRVEELLEETFG